MHIITVGFVPDFLRVKIVFVFCVGCWEFSVGSLVGGKMHGITIGFVPDFLRVKIDAKK